jgi:hypothetical protein
MKIPKQEYTAEFKTLAVQSPGGGRGAEGEKQKGIECLEAGKEARRLDTSLHLVNRACRFVMRHLPLRPARVRTR